MLVLLLCGLLKSKAKINRKRKHRVQLSACMWMEQLDQSIYICEWDLWTTLNKHTHTYTEADPLRSAVMHIYEIRRLKWRRKQINKVFTFNSRACFVRHKMLDAKKLNEFECYCWVSTRRTCVYHLFAISSLSRSAS